MYTNKLYSTSILCSFSFDSNDKLAHEITAMWNVDLTIIVSIVASVNRLVAKSFDQHLKKLLLGRWIKGRVQQAVMLETACFMRRFLTL